MNYVYHIIKNFPEKYPWWKKTMANMIFFFGKTIIYPRKNLLSNEDLKMAKQLLKKGDVILVGGLRRLSSLIIKGPHTHAMLYIGRSNVVHAVCDGVAIDSLQAVFGEYDTMAILRPKTKSRKKIENACNYAISKLGIPFDYEFQDGSEKFYCSELVKTSLEHAKIKTGIEKSKIPIHPKSFKNSYFKVIFLSHNLKSRTDLDAARV